MWPARRRLASDPPGRPSGLPGVGGGGPGPPAEHTGASVSPRTAGPTPTERKVVQIECYRRVEKLRNRQDEIKNKLKEVLTIKELQKKEEENVDSDDEGELQDLSH